MATVIFSVNVGLDASDSDLVISIEEEDVVVSASLPLTETDAAGFHEDDDAASSIENDWDGSRGVDCDRRNRYFDGGGTDEDGGASLCDGAGPSDEDVGASELEDAGGGGCDEDAGASELDDEGGGGASDESDGASDEDGGGASDEDGGGVSDEEDFGGFLESSIVKEKTLNQRKTSNERNSNR
ncbi:hypothetical protein TSUD_219350 [Trifolium subterraneum]|uniref:Uncharacterized protein n=1 Tax=Trifolium subterraneum TaxID=3900 RepID=A0A2Z6MT67_TRISU|nr:hypothetical protein TSUD_219350 [Trifolium subterraneum]